MAKQTNAKPSPEDAQKALKGKGGDNAAEPQENGGEKEQPQAAEGDEQPEAPAAAAPPAQEPAEQNYPGESSEDKPVVIPVPTDEQIEETAQQLAGNPELMDALKKTFDRAQAICKEANKPAAPTAEELEVAAYERLVAKYGKDFVTAERGTNKKYFSRLTWNIMGKNHQGWAEITKVAPEVAATK